MYKIDFNDLLFLDVLVIVYMDIKSLYVFLVKDLIYVLEDKYGVDFDWWLLIFDILSYFGNVKVGEGGKVLEGDCFFW